MLVESRKGRLLGGIMNREKYNSWRKPVVLGKVWDDILGKCDYNMLYSRDF
jgi:hypothetical protein